MVAVQANKISRLRAANERLRESEREVQELSRRNQEIPRLRAETAALAELRAANKELPAIRNEIRQLRSRKGELAEARAEHQLLLARQKAAGGQSEAGALPAGSITQAALADSGLASPEATVQTFFWAMCRGNLERLAECCSGRPALRAGEESAEKLEQAKDMLQVIGLEAPGQTTEELRQGLVAQTRCFPGYRITSQKALSADEVEVGVQCLDGGEVMTLRLQSFQRPRHFSWTIGE